jgi:hypothetical protein
MATPSQGSIVDWLGRLLRNVPVTAWVATIRNTLRYFGLQDVLAVVVALTLIVGSFGLSATQRILVFVVLAVFMSSGRFVIAYISRLPGDRLYSPEDRLLGRGRNYASSDQPRSREPVLDQPKQLPPGRQGSDLPEPPALPPPSDETAI